MPRLRRFLDVDVLVAARRRFAQIYDTFDSVAVMFSGGKDSLVCLSLAREQAEQRGKPVDVVFRDEELIPDSVIRFVDQYRQEPWIRMLWYAVPLVSHKFVLGVLTDYLQWDPNRPWVRDKPEWAITNADLGVPKSTTFEQYSMDEMVAKNYRGKTAFALGMRATESLNRYRSLIAKEHENWISNISPRLALVKPIYDWSQQDVFLFLAEHGISWCDLYESQGLAGGNLRVSTPLHAESSKRFDEIRRVDPDFYQRIVDQFPDMLLQERYWGEFDVKKLVARYASNGYTGIYEYVNEHVHDPIVRRRLLARIREYRTAAQKHPGVRSPEHLMAEILAGAGKRGIGGPDLRQVKTHCKHGHEYTPENTKTAGSGRVCRTCAQRRGRD